MCPRRFPFLAFFLLAPALAAQVPDSALFHKGQWGVDFRVGSGFAGVGALHFTSPTHAMLLDLNGGYSHGSTTVSPASHGNSVNAALSLGTRAYHRLDPHPVGKSGVVFNGIGQRRLPAQLHPGQNDRL